MYLAIDYNMIERSPNFTESLKNTVEKWRDVLQTFVCIFQSRS